MFKDNGFEYYVDKKIKNGTIAYRCKNFNKGCKARLHVCQDVVIKRIKTHNCNIERKKEEVEIKREDEEEENEREEEDEEEDEEGEEEEEEEEEEDDDGDENLSKCCFTVNQELVRQMKELRKKNEESQVLFKRIQRHTKELINEGKLLRKLMEKIEEKNKTLERENLKLRQQIMLAPSLPSAKAKTDETNELLRNIVSEIEKEIHDARSERDRVVNKFKF